MNVARLNRKTAEIQARREGRGKLEGAYIDVRD